MYPYIALTLVQYIFQFALSQVQVLRMNDLQNIHRLLAYLLELILHLHHEFLDSGMVGLGAGSVDLAPHLLDDESQFLSRIWFNLSSNRVEPRTRHRPGDMQSHRCR